MAKSVDPEPSAPAGGYADYLSAAAARWPERTGLHFEGATWTYRQLQDAVERAAALLSSVGIRAGLRVLLLAENCPEYLIAQFALARLGAVFVTPNPYWTDSELSHAMAVSGATAAIHDARHSAIAESMDCAVAVESLTVGAPAPAVPEPANHSAALYIPFSSGTTGMAKGVVHTGASLCGGVEQLRHHLALTEHDRLQLSLPLCHIFGATMSAAAISVGADLTLFRRFDLTAALRHIRDAEVTVWPIAGAVAHQLAHRDDLDRNDFRSLRLFMWGGSALPAELANKVSDRTGLCSYGITEAMMLAFNPIDRPHDWRLESPGFATRGTDIQVADDGELLVRGPSVATGYAAVESSAFTDGWFATGDIGSIDDDGRLWITDRRKDMLKVSGFQVAPTEVENALLSHPGVDEAAVIGRPDQRTGETPVAFVVGAADVTSSSLDSWVSSRLATYKRPTRYVFVDRLPRTAGGKLRRAGLRDRG